MVFKQNWELRNAQYKLYYIYNYGNPNLNYAPGEHGGGECSRKSELDVVARVEPPAAHVTVRNKFLVL